MEPHYSFVRALDLSVRSGKPKGIQKG